MKENYDKELSLEMVASRFGFTPSYLSHMFREYAQTGYRTYLMDLRVKYAMRELLNSDRYVGTLLWTMGLPMQGHLPKPLKAVRLSAQPVPQADESETGDSEAGGSEAGESETGQPKTGQSKTEEPQVIGGE